MKTVVSNSGITNTKELCRITFDDGEFFRLNVQTYENKQRCYSVEKCNGHLSKTPAVTTSNDIEEIISYYERLSKDTKEQADSMREDMVKVKDIYYGVAAKFDEFVNKLNGFK